MTERTHNPTKELLDEASRLVLIAKMNSDSSADWRELFIDYVSDLCDEVEKLGDLID